MTDTDTPARDRDRGRDRAADAAHGAVGAPTGARGGGAVALDAARDVRAERAGTGPPVEGRGVTRIDEVVVAKVAAMAARRVDGVVDLGRGGSGGGLTGLFGGGDDGDRGEGGAPPEARTDGVDVEVSPTRAAIDLDLRVPWGAPVVDVTRAVRRSVVDRVEDLLGLTVVEVNVTVVDFVVAGAGEAAGALRSDRTDRVGTDRTAGLTGGSRGRVDAPPQETRERRLR